MVLPKRSCTPFVFEPLEARLLLDAIPGEPSPAPLPEALVAETAPLGAQEAAETAPLADTPTVVKQVDFTSLAGWTATAGSTTTLDAGHAFYSPTAFQFSPSGLGLYTNPSALKTSDAALDVRGKTLHLSFYVHPDAESSVSLVQVALLSDDDDGVDGGAADNTHAMVLRFYAAVQPGWNDIVYPIQSQASLLDYPDSNFNGWQVQGASWDPSQATGVQLRVAFSATPPGDTMYVWFDAVRVLSGYGKARLILTFDGCGNSASLAATAIPEALAHAFPVTAGITPPLVGQSFAWTLDQLRALDANPLAELVGHGYNHPSDFGTYTREQKLNEVTATKAWAEANGLTLSPVFMVPGKSAQLTADEFSDILGEVSVILDTIQYSPRTLQPNFVASMVETANGQPDRRMLARNVSDTGLTAQWIDDLVANQAMGASYIHGLGGARQLTAAQWVAFLAHVQAHVDAGDLEVISLSNYESGYETVASWTGTAGADWASPGNWLAGRVPGADSPVILTGTPTARQPTLYQNQAVAGLDIQTAGWTVGGTGYTLTAGDGGIDSAGSGSNTVAANVALAADSTWTIAAGDTLVLNGTIRGNAHTLTVEGGGTLRLVGGQDHTTGLSLNVSAATVRWDAPKQVLVLDGLDLGNLLGSLGLWGGTSQAAAPSSPSVPTGVASRSEVPVAAVATSGVEVPAPALAATPKPGIEASEWALHVDLLPASPGPLAEAGGMSVLPGPSVTGATTGPFGAVVVAAPLAIAPGEASVAEAVEPGAGVVRPLVETAGIPLAADAEDLGDGLIDALAPAQPLLTYGATAQRA